MFKRILDLNEKQQIYRIQKKIEDREEMKKENVIRLYKVTL